MAHKLHISGTSRGRHGKKGLGKDAGTKFEFSATACSLFQLEMLDL